MTWNDFYCSPDGNGWFRRERETNFSHSTSPQGDDKRGIAATVEEGTARKQVRNVNARTDAKGAGYGIAAPDEVLRAQAGRPVFTWPNPVQSDSRERPATIGRWSTKADALLAEGK